MFHTIFYIVSWKIMSIKIVLGIYLIFGYHIETDYGIFSMQGNNITNQINTHIN